MHQTSAAYQKTITTSHRTTIQASLMRGGKTVFGNLPLTGGNLSIDANSFARRSVELQLPATINGQPTKDIIRTTGDEIFIKHGLVFSDGSIEWVPIGVFRVDTIPQNAHSATEIVVKGVDRAADLIDDIFLQPLAFTAGSTTSLITQLIKETLPTATVINQTTVRDARVPTTHADGQRSAFIQTLASSIGAVVYCNGYGDFVIADAPKLTDTPVYTVRPGVNGSLVSADWELTRHGVYNQIIVRGQSPSGDFQPVQAVARDTDPSSPTRYGDRLAGAFGKITKIIDSATIATHAQAMQVAQSELAKRVGITESMNLSTVPLVFLEPGDSIIVLPDSAPAARSARKHIIDQINFDLKAGGEFTMRTRDIREVNLE